MKAQWLKYLRFGVAVLLPAVLAVALASSPLIAATSTGLLKAREGVSALLRGKYEQAIAAYSEALEDETLSDPRRANIYNDLGVAKWRLKRVKDAIEDFNQAITLFPDYAVIYNNRGNALTDLGRPDEAVADFDRAVTLAPAYAAAYNNRGNAYYALEKYAEAARDFRKAAQLLPTNAVPYNGRGKAHNALGHPFAAIRDFNRAITLNAKYYSAHENRALALVAVDKHDEAISDLTQVIEARPEDARLYLARGKAYGSAKQYNPAFRDLDKAIKLAPELVDAYLARAELQFALKRFEPARADLTAALAINAELQSAYVKRAEASLRNGEPANGVPDVEKALELKPGDPKALEVRAIIRDMLGQKEQALADYQAVLAADPANAAARAAYQQAGLEAPPLPQPAPLGEEVKGWTIARDAKGRYIAANARFPKLAVTLEMYGDGEPAIIDWNLLKDNLQGIGLLEYYAGSLKGEGDRRLEYVAIVDLWRNKVVSIEPDRWGPVQATWNWQQVSVVITDPDGASNEIQLRKAPPPPPVAEEQERPFFGDGFFREERRARRREREPRGLLDWLFR